MKSHMKSGIALLGMLLLVPVVAGTSAYQDDLSELSSRLRATFVRAEGIRPSDFEKRNAIQHDLFEISKRLHRLEEEAGGANLSLLKSGAEGDSNLSIAGGTAKALDLAQSMLSSYLDTNNKIFWSTGLEVMKLSRDLQAAQR